MARRHGGAAADLPPLHPPSKRPWSPSTWRFAMEEEEEEEEEELPGLHLPLPAPAPPLAKARLAPLPPPPQWRSKSGRAADLRAANDGGGGSHGFYDCSFSNYYPYSNQNHNHSYYSYYSSSTHTNASYSSYSRNGGFVWDAGEDGGGITMLLQRRRWRRGWNAEDYGGEGAVAMWKSEAGTGILQVKAKEAVSRKARQEEMAEDVESKDMNRSRSRRRRERRSESEPEPEPEPEEDRDGTAANAEAGVMEKQQQQQQEEEEEEGEGDIGKWRRRQKLQKVQNQKVQKKQKKLKKKQKKKAGEQREMSPSERYYCEICRNSMAASASALLPLGHHHHNL